MNTLTKGAYSNSIQTVIGTAKPHLVIKEIKKMLKFLKREANKAYTENGAASNASTMSDCLDLFATAGALRNASDDEILERFIRAFAEDRDIAMKTLFFARDIRGGLGERRFFRVIMKYLAQNYPETVIKNIDNIAEYGRYDDILSLMDTACEQEAIAYIKAVLQEDIESMQAQDSVSLMAKWLPSVNASSKETVRTARKIAKAMGMSDASYRKMLSSLRAYIKILENNLRTRDYSFEYEKQPSKALFKYRKAFIRNDEDRYEAFIRKAVANPSVMNTSCLTPYDIVWAVIKGVRMGMPNAEKKMMLNAAVAESLGIYFAERNKGAFKNHFITFSANPRLVEIKGRDIFEKVQYCMSFNECSNTNIEKTFEMILDTAVKNRLKQSDMPSRIIIISDMEFDWCAERADMTNFEYAKELFAESGYKLPKLVFWNVNSYNRQQPVTMNEEGVTLVSGMSPQIFAMLKEDNLNPYAFMMSVISSARYEKIAA